MDGRLQLLSDGATRSRTLTRVCICICTPSSFVSPDSRLYLRLHGGLCAPTVGCVCRALVLEPGVSIASGLLCRSVLLGACIAAATYCSLDCLPAESRHCSTTLLLLEGSLSAAVRADVIAGCFRICNSIDSSLGLSPAAQNQTSERTTGRHGPRLCDEMR
ncbi:hypothetical protein BDV95DRAFT_219515 [Massariosphaeria phaeospora]|uniref:Uncharacterized protein n=1 Tax=Massariosphaeria phaeospora TaxID=100035 RepID=A0A7C8MGW2_9PLEO|nr:hypothetical protein BDV95DRAFT_219515 [Massariosphaeria phaeospora]